MTPALANGRPLRGLALPNDRNFLQLCRPVVEERAEFFEVTPETLWRAGAEPGAGYPQMRDLLARLGRPVVGHGVMLGLGDAEPGPRREQWLRALARDRDRFGFRWFSEHLGFSAAGGAHATLPLPLPASSEAAATAAGALRSLHSVTQTVLFENNADLFSFGDPLAQPGLFAAICELADAWLLLDLHNGYTFCSNLEVPFDRWLDALPWDRVLEIHVSGGSHSDPEWLPSRRVLRLDSHDGAVPEPVWLALGQSLRRAPNLQGVVLEWLPDGMTAAHADVLGRDFERLGSMLC